MDAPTLEAGTGEHFGKWHVMLLRLINAVHRDNGEKAQAIGIEPAFEQALRAIEASRLPMLVQSAAGHDYQSDLFDVLETLKMHYPQIAGGFARGTGGFDRDYILDELRKPASASATPERYSREDLKRWHHLGHDDDGIPCD